jgi:class 3 adenylate cyclase
VPTDFINAIGRQSILEVKLGDHIKQDMTVMFCDIRSYSLMSEGMTAEQNFSFINEYLKRVGPVIQKNNGFINHYFGDGFIALFKDTPENAVKAAIQIMEEINLYNVERLSTGNKPIAVGFGLHKGPVMMGIIGDDQRHDANVLSDAVNISSRLEGLTKLFGSNIVLSDSLYQAINADEFQFRFLGRIKVKGKEDVMGVYEMFSADDSKMKELKQKTLDVFNKGLTDYFAKRFAEAALSLRQTLDANPDDLSAKRYLQNSARFMVEGVHTTWDGVEEMNEK